MTDAKPAMTYIKVFDANGMPIGERQVPTAVIECCAKVKDYFERNPSHTIYGIGLRR